MDPESSSMNIHTFAVATAWYKGDAWSSGTMAEAPFFSSQGSEYETHRIMDEGENLETRRPRKAPTVTPKRFKKFFTPRASLSSSTSKRQSKAGRQLRDITKNGINLRREMDASHKLDASDISTALARPAKRRKCSIDIVSSPPLQSSPLKRMQPFDALDVLEDQPLSPALSDSDGLDLEDVGPSLPIPIRQLRYQGRSRSLLERSFGGYDALSRGRTAPSHSYDWKHHTADFASNPTDVHHFSRAALPFCTASCSTNSLVALGDEEGRIRLVDTARASDFSIAHVSFRPHHNALMDIAFNSDDYMLATASGDQTARIVDMHTQQTICILSGHKSSVKQIRFQPDNDNMLTTSSRDGTVLLWDMRCASKGSIATLHTAFARNVDTGGFDPPVRYAKHTLDAGMAHRSVRSAVTRTASNDATDHVGTSITAIQHLSGRRNHWLLTTSEIDSSIKVWDLRNVSRRNAGALLSSTAVPTTHSKTRNYGINAMALSGDGSRLYTVCRDGVVYAYSTNHLALDCASEPSPASTGKLRVPKGSKCGKGPLYGFRHPSLRIGTFYIKAAIRPSRRDQSEMLAIGSSEGSPIIFPTDEASFPRRRPCDDDDGDEAALPSLATRNAKSAVSSEIPIHAHGTSLIRGHDKEVTSLTWSSEGALVTISDDFSARCWREDGEKARQLRGCGEGEGSRWSCGWADVEAEWDEEDG